MFIARVSNLRNVKIGGKRIKIHIYFLSIVAMETWVKSIWGFRIRKVRSCIIGYCLYLIRWNLYGLLFQCLIIFYFGLLICKLQTIFMWAHNIIKIILLFLKIDLSFAKVNSQLIFLTQWDLTSFKTWGKFHLVLKNSRGVPLIFLYSRNWKPVSHNNFVDTMTIHTHTPTPILWN